MEVRELENTENGRKNMSVNESQLSQSNKHDLYVAIDGIYLLPGCHIKQYTLQRRLGKSTNATEKQSKASENKNLHAIKFFRCNEAVSKFKSQPPSINST
ncbi:hypothetical protein JTB14_037757 [Gonioctena quinquepunctata]|nr:hypothetical protein JTB14_037757 [Gonioctena quinquepunctata]